MSNEIKHISGAAGGYLIGNSHDNGGIQAINKAIGKPLEMEGGEVVITKPAVEDNELREFEGKMLTNRQILSKINESGGGVSFAELGAELPTKIEFCGTEYKYGGETLTDYEIAHRISKCGCSHEEDSYADGGELESIISEKFTQGYGKVKYLEISESGGNWKYIHNPNMTVSQRKNAPVFTVESSEEDRKLAQENRINYENNLPTEISILDYAKKVAKSNNAIITHKSNSGSVYLVIKNPSTNSDEHFQTIRISDHYILDRDSMNPKSRHDYEIVQKNFYENDSTDLKEIFEEDIFANGGNLEKDLKDNAVNVAVNATDTLPLMEKGGETSSNEIMELVISPDNNLSKQLVEQTGDYWNAHDFANIDESITDLSFMKPFYHKETGKKFVVIDPNMQPTRKPKYNVGDNVTYKSGDIESETWVGVVKEVKDFDTEYAYRLDAYTTDVDPPMFDSEKTNETYEASLKPSKKETFEDAQESYRRWKNKLIKKSDLRLIGAIGKNVVQNKSVIFNNENYQDIAFIYPNGKIEYLVNDLPEEVIKYIESMPTPLEAENTNKTYQISDYKNPYEVNRAIEALLDSKNDNEDFNSNEIEFISHYSGYGGLAKYGEFTQEEITKILSEFFTPEEVVKKMWALAYKYGFGVIENPKVLEPSVGTGNFFKYAPKNAELYANEINRYSKEICEILYPEANVSLQYFEQNFLEKNNSIKNKIQKLQKYDLVIGNPPYGRLGGKFMNMGEDTYTKASTFTEYFILRGLDLLKPGGLLIYIVGAEQYNGGTLFLDSKPNFAKKQIADKAQLIDAYRLPIKIFERTGVSSEIVVFKKN